MRTVWKDICTAVLLGAVLPGIMVNISALLLNASARETPVAEVTIPVQEERKTIPIILRDTEGGAQQMDMEEYLTGVLLGEMPAEFALEALKAQAVAARTYTAKAMDTGGKHGDGSLCTDPTCCQAYLSPEAYLTAGGTEANLEKICTAVSDTANMVLTYEGTLIEATYFSCSGGKTEDAVAVWGTDYPYLLAVDSPGEEEAAHYRDTLQFTPEVFQAKLGRELSGSPVSWFRHTSYTAGGGVETMEIGGESYSGIALRSLLGLPSTSFSVIVEEDTIYISTRGYGHRVGMSQYGADAMAEAGSLYPEILAHYYPGTSLERLS